MKLSSRQLYFYLACIAPVGKLVILPAKLSDAVGNDLLLPAALQILFQAAAVFFVLLLSKKNKTLFELLSERLGKGLAGAITLLISAFLLFAAFLPLIEQKLFVQGTFYDTIPSIAAFAPFFLVSAYLCSKPLLSEGRVFDLLAPVAIVGFLGIIILSAPNAEFAAILPVGGAGVKKILSGAVFASSWFFDAAILLMFLGHITYEKGTALKGALFYLLGGTAVLLFLAVFYGIFEETAPNQIFAFTNTSKYFSGITVLGRVDFLFIYALALVMVFYLALPIQAGIEGVLQVFGKKRYLPTILSVLIHILLIGGVFYYDFRFGEAVDLFSKKLCFLFPLFSIALPVIFYLFRRREHEKS